MLLCCLFKTCLMLVSYHNQRSNTPLQPTARPRPRGHSPGLWPPRYPLQSPNPKLSSQSQAAAAPSISPPRRPSLPRGRKLRVANLPTRARLKPIEALLSFLASFFFPQRRLAPFCSPIVGSYDQRSATSRALFRSPPMSCRASPWSRPSLPAGPLFPTSGRPRSPLGEVHEPQPAF